MTDRVLAYLRKFATENSRSFTNLPMEITITDELPINITRSKGKVGMERILAKPYVSNLYPADKRRKIELKGFGIALDRTYYNNNKHNLPGLKETILHELAHIKRDKDFYSNGGFKSGIKQHGHDNVYKKVAKDLGCGRDCASATTDSGKLSHADQKALIERYKQQPKRSKTETWSLSE